MFLIIKVLYFGFSGVMEMVEIQKKNCEILFRENCWKNTVFTQISKYMGFILNNYLFCSEISVWSEYYKVDIRFYNKSKQIKLYGIICQRKILRLKLCFF